VVATGDRSSAYLIRLKVPLADEAAALARDLERNGASVEREDAIVTAVWPASDADDLERWKDYTFTELVFFLRSWAGSRRDRQLEVLEERLVAVAT
jgi:hypothetical protein